MIEGYSGESLKLLNKHKRYRLLHNQQEIDRRKKWNSSHKKERIALRLRNKERDAEYKRMWREKNRLYMQLSDFNYRHGTKFSLKDLDNIFKYQSGVCVYCEEPLIYGFHIDHKHPKRKGGNSEFSNIQLTCKRCNLSKGAKTHEEYISYYNEVYND